MLFPDDVQVGLQAGLQWTEAKGAVTGSIHQPVEAQGIADALLHHEGRVVNQVIGHHDIHFIRGAAEPAGQLVLPEGLP